jgi:tagatose 1,6-diphosphate aldolase
MSISLGKRRALQQCVQDDGTFAMLALDQRGNLKRSIQAENPDAVTFAQMAAVKQAIIRALSPYASATLLDAEYGYPACVAGDALSGRSGLLLAIEATGYEGDPTERKSRILDHWSVEKIRRAGASGVKLLVYYHPDAPNAAGQEELVAEVARACRQWDLPFFLEPLHYSLTPGVSRVPDAERRRVVIESARRLVPLGADVLKAEFPVDVAQNDDEAAWAEACIELSETCPAPWVLLSAGVDYATFARQLAVACRNGASGMLCGRAIWKEAVPLGDNDRTAFLHTTGVARITRLRHIVSAMARPLTDFYPAGSGIDREGWYVKEGTDQ